MKILIVNDYGVLSGGAERISFTLRDGLRGRGHDVRLFTSRARPLGLPVLADYTCYGSETPVRRLLQAANPAAPPALRRALRDFRPDVVHVRMFLTQLSPLILPELRAVATLFHVVNYQHICPLNTKLLPDGSACANRAGIACWRAGCVSLPGLGRVLLQQHLLRRWRDTRDVVVANSEWTARRLRADGVPVARVIWNGVAVRPARPPPDGPPTVAYAGRLVDKKGVQVLLRAVADVRARLPAVRLLIAGDGPDRSSVERTIAELRLQDVVSVLGHLERERMEQALAGVWVQAVPSLWEEPFGLAAAEAMMRGTAVVASASGGLSEIIEHGRTGLLVPPGDASALAAALHGLLSDPQRTRAMGEAGRGFALAELTEDRLLDRFLELYATLTAASGRPPVERAG